MLSSLSSEQTAHLVAIKKLICDEIKQTGSITFARYMDLALYAPQLGYYRASRPKFGKEGDFVTAPEISSLFSACIAQQCKEISTHLPTFQILEFGAGSGKMACDILQTLARENTLPEKYFILEVSGFLQHTQKNKINELIPELADRVEWITSLPQNFTGIILANEIIDAMPVHRFTVTESGIQEFYVVEEKNEFAWKLQSPSTSALTHAIEQLKLQPYYESEINLFLPAWIQSLSECLKQGVILLIDYGFPQHEFYHPDRSMGTLMCHYQHRAHSDPLILTGLQDITAHVDFTQVADSAVNAELDVLGFTNQAAFLINLGLLSLLQQHADIHPKLQHVLTQQAKILTLPSEMGELFKVIALGKDYDESLQGFLTQDQRQRL